jgi:hypothetical protein
MWKLKNFAEGASKSENALLVKSKLETLRKKIKCIKTMEVGFNINESPTAYDVVLCAEFETPEDLNHYKTHPEHKKVGDFVTKVRLERKAIDYQITGNLVNKKS